MSSIVVRSARIALAPGQVANLRVSVDRSLATAGGPGAGVVVNTPVTTQGFSIVLPAITLYTTWDAPDQTTKEAQYKAELIDANGVALYTLSSLDNFQLRIVAAQTTWKEVTEYNEFLRESQSKTPPDAPQQYDSNPILLAPLNIFLGLGSNTSTDSMGLYVGNTDNPPGLRHNVATGFWEFSHDGTTWTTMGSGGGGGGTPGGPANSVQYNMGGSFGGDARITIDSSSGFLVLGAGVTNGGLQINGINGNHWVLSTTSPDANRTLYLPNTTLPTQGQALIAQTVGATVNLGWQTVLAGTCAANGVLVGTGVNTAASSGGLLWNAGVLTTQVTGNSFAGVIANNSTSGTASEVGFTGTSSNAGFQLNATSSLFPVSGLRKPNQVYLFASASAAELLLQTGDDAVPFVFGTNVTERMRLNATGLGIGGISPSTRLDVDSGTADDSGLRLRRMANATPATTSTHYLGYDPTNGKVVRATTPSGGGGGGTVTSVALALPSIFGVSGSPVTASGTLTGTLNNQAANQIFAGPSSGGAATPTFRALVEADIPTLTVAGKVNTSALTGTLAAAQFPALTGDVTTTAGSLATTIAAQAVTFAKMQNVATGVLLGRSTAGAGSLETIGIGTGLSLSGGLLSVTGSLINGSITANQIAVASGANTIGGSAALLYDNGQLNLAAVLDQTNYISVGNTSTGGSGRALLSADANVASVALYATGSGWAFPGFPGASASAVDAIGGPLYFISEAAQPQIWGLGATEAMRLNSTGLGLGNPPSTKLDITSAGANDSGLRLRNLTNASPAGAETAYLAVDSIGKVVRAANPGAGSTPPFADNAALVKNNADNTKLAILSAASITTATTRTFTLPDANGTLPLLGLAQTFTAAQTIQSTAAAAFAVGANGATNPVLQVDASTGSVVTGLKVTGAATGSGVTLAAIGSGANESLKLVGKGTGSLTWNGTAFVVDSTGVGALTSLTLTGIETLPFTTGSTVGVLYASTERLLHLYTNANALANELAGNGFANAYNTFLGVGAGNFTSSGSPSTSLGGRNIAIGYRAGAANTTGWQNTALGFISQMKTTSGTYNTSVGAYTLVENTTGNNNTAIGADALWLSTTGTDNTALGCYTGQQNTTGSSNTYVGSQSGRQTTTGNNNTAVGFEAFRLNTTASQNAAFGYQTLKANTTGANNAAFGAFAMNVNQTGANNAAFGYGALQSVTGNNNTAVGFGAGDDVTSGTNNALFGLQAGNALTTGSNNTLLGYLAGANLTTGGTNIIIGASVNADSATANNQLNIGGAIKGDLSTGFVGIGTATPASRLQVTDTTAGGVVARFNGAGSGTTLWSDLYQSTGSSVAAGILFASGNLTFGYYVRPGTGTTDRYDSTTTDNIARASFEVGAQLFKWKTAAAQTVAIGSAITLTERMRLDGGNLGLGATAFGTSADKVFAVGIGTAPTTSPADTAQHYTADAAATDAQALVRNEQGRIARLTGTLQVLNQAFAKTNATLANVVGGSVANDLLFNVETGSTYRVRVALQLDAEFAAGGVKVALGGTVTLNTTLSALQIQIWRNDTNVIAASGRVNATGAAVSATGAADGSTYYAVIEGSIFVTTGGTFTVQFAQAAAAGTSNVLPGSYMEIARHS